MTTAEKFYKQLTRPHDALKASLMVRNIFQTQKSHENINEQGETSQNSNDIDYEHEDIIMQGETSQESYDIDYEPDDIVMQG